ncbi:MAG: radical SAM protein [Gammaproteobacteria bacterium]|nr:radical SAM protein [Gammaproteobacteria bacterium]
MISDSHGRTFRNLRVSLTAACNYACTYCVPDGKRLLPARYELSGEQLIRAVTLLIKVAGIDKVRITGGEPLLSPKIDEFFPAVMRLGLKDVSLTTNGQLLARKAAMLLDAGIRRINISLDTLNPNAFREIARSGDLATVLAGIDLMAEAGVRIKINMVPLRSANLDQVLPLLDYCLKRGFELRFIELMKMGHLRAGNQFTRDFIGMDELLGMIATRYTYTRTEAPFDSTAIRFEVPGKGTFGIIANETEPFCATCTRLRLSSNGKLYGCLSNNRSHWLSPVLELLDAEAEAALAQILGQALGDKQPVRFQGEWTVMKFIGG